MHAGRDDLQCRHTDQWTVCAEREPLRDRARDPESRERARAAAERDCVQCTERDPRFGEDRIDHRKQQLGVPPRRHRMTRDSDPRVLQRAGARIGGGLDGQDVHEA